MLNHFEKMFSMVRNYVWSEGYKHLEVVKTNPKKKDVSTRFDLEAENIIINYCKKNHLPVKIFTEESGEVNVSSQEPEYILIVDPVDGSTNLKRGIEGTAMSIAAVRYNINGVIKPSDVEFALIGSLVSGSLCKAEKGKGIYYKGIFSGNKEVQVHGSKCQDLKRACVDIDLDFELDEVSDVVDDTKPSKIKRILNLIYPKRKVKYIRRYGSAAIGLMEVAKGSVDSYIDARDISTPENWIGAYLLIHEAGGVFTDLYGNEPENISDLTQPYSYIASGNETLHKKILEIVRNYI